MDPMAAPELAPFRHEALLYADDAEYRAGTLPLVRNAIERAEPVMVAAGPDKLDLLRAELGDDARSVLFADMRVIGVNPGAIISEWREFVDHRAAGGGPIWGIGEPVWPSRSPAELAECHRHECLLNAAFADTPGFTLLCPYDVAALPAEVIQRAHESHPVVVEDGEGRGSDRYIGLDGLDQMLHGPLPEPAVAPEELPFDSGGLPALRVVVLDRARTAGFGEQGAEDVVLAVNELTSNTVTYGGGEGVLRLWEEDGAVVVEVQDRGWIGDPLVGRLLPGGGAPGGFGLWMVNQLAELVQVRSSELGTAIRLYMRPGRVRRA